ncbi:MAG: hypothetical protein JSR66_28120 [Proteobacteria bacterium]|nr:hypothetical protein [Pseudomonadota bacterium]
MQVHQYDQLAEAGVQLAVNAHGTAALIWRERSGMDGVRLWASRFAPDSKQWSTPTSLALLGGGDDLSADAVPHVAIADSGDTLAVWPQQVNGTNEVWESRYTDAGSWSVAARIDTAVVSQAYSQVVYDSAGNAFVLWQQLDGTRNHVYYSRLPVGTTTWSAPVQMDTATGNAVRPYVVADAHGNLVAVWMQTDSPQAGSVSHIWSSNYQSSTGHWSVPAAMIANDATLSAFLPKLAVNAAGAAEVIWVQDDNSIWSNHYTPASGWGAPLLVEAGGNNNGLPEVAIDQTGNAMAVWMRSDPTVPQLAHLRYTVLPVGGNWSASAVISEADSATSEYTESPQIAFDAQGDAVAIWTRTHEGQISVGRSAVYTPGAGWSAPVAVDDGSVVDDGAALAVAPNGTAISAWREFANSISTILTTLFE